MAASKTAIANFALSHLKTDPVLSIDPPDENSTPAQVMDKWYDQARQDTLEAHTWNCATKRVTIAKDASAPAFEYDNRYLLPSDFIRLGRLGEDWNFPEMDYEIEDGYFITSVTSPLKIVYVYDLTDVTKMSPKLVTSISYKLASFAAYEITGDRNITSMMEELFRASVTEAASVDGQNRPTRRIQSSRLADARRNTGRFRDWQHWSDS